MGQHRLTSQVCFNIIKLLNLRTPENFALIYLKDKQTNLKVFSQKDANGIANSVDPDQTAQTYLSENL